MTWNRVELCRAPTARRYLDLRTDDFGEFVAGVSIDRAHPHGPYVVRRERTRRKVACRTVDEVVAEIAKLGLPAVERAEIEWVGGR